MQRLVASDIQIMTGAVSAIDRNRASLSLRPIAFKRPSAIRAARNISGVDMAMRNSCSETTWSAELAPANGPRPWTAPEIDMIATIRREMLTPSGPKRMAAQRRSGRGRYTRAGTLPSPALGQLKTRAQMAINRQTIRQISTRRGTKTTLGAVYATPMQRRIAGAKGKNATGLERNQTRQ